MLSATPCRRVGTGHEACPDPARNEPSPAGDGRCAGGFETGGEKMKHATSHELYGYWDRVRHGQPAPKRSDIEPSDIRRILADTFILEVAGRENYIIRLAGTRICSLFCREMKGGNFLDLWSVEDRNAMATLGTAVAEDAAGAVVTFTATTSGNHSLTAELLMLPLSHSGERYDRVLGAISPLERPYWVGSEPIVSQTVVSLSSRMRVRVSANTAEPGARTRIQGGLRATGWSGRCAFSGWRTPFGLKRASAMSMSRVIQII